MPDPKKPNPRQPPRPSHVPEPPIDEPEPDMLPDENPAPNPDENREPPIQMSAGQGIGCTA